MKKIIAFFVALLMPFSALAELEAHFLDVGQGDACIIVCDGEAMMIDGGPPGASGKVFSYIKELGLTELKYIVASHPHEDHIGGISAALNAVPVGCIFSPVLEWDTRAFSSMMKYANMSGTPVVVPFDGDAFTVGGATATVLQCWPEAWTANDMSIILRVDYGKHSFLFTGDAEYMTEYMLIDSGVDLDVDVLKISHHGSDTATTVEFIDAVSPSLAVISVGAGNQYGHPTQEVLQRLVGIEVVRTDLDGDIILRCCETIERSCEK